MPRIRSLKPEHKQHRKVGRLPDRTYRTWVGMITEADDEGRLVADPGQLRVLIFGYHPDVTDETVEEALDRLAKEGLIRLYTIGDTRYADFPSWHQHQHINRPSPSKLPSYEDSLRLHGACSEPSVNGHAGSDRIGSDQGSRSTTSSAGAEAREAASLPDLFRVFIEKYPNPGDLNHARNAWVKNVHDEATARAALAGLDRHLEYWIETTEPEYTPTAGRWLYRGMWTLRIPEVAEVERFVDAYLDGWERRYREEFPLDDAQLSKLRGIARDLLDGEEGEFSPRPPIPISRLIEMLRLYFLDDYFENPDRSEHAVDHHRHSIEGFRGNISKFHAQTAPGGQA